ncbi:hypothetical protein GHO41_14530 [Pseudomonas sp. FSL R10-0399]|uniref:hypothetical protein n=1 Tax=Pseudomonas sp. FSL R10-0399 TaxID=2662194 RepID=UPI0012948F96|nr:hypothetical protein [Pseudomonas sp. FSL R10-0399]MQT58549.1 hypothetical protein [Pseudomonas sp. FSL R10-0399]
MSINSRLAALKMVITALDEVQTFNGNLPAYDDAGEGGGAAPETFMALVKQYAGNRVEDSELVEVIDSMDVLFPEYEFSWK